MPYEFNDGRYWYHDDSAAQKIKNAIDEFNKFKSEVNDGRASDMLESVKVFIDDALPELIELLDSAIDKLEGEHGEDV